jgi:hypothetical protein
VTGFIVEDIESAAAAVGRLDEIDRAGVRATFERRFDVARMAQDYVDVYERLVAGWAPLPSAAIPIGAEEAGAGV